MVSEAWIGPNLSTKPIDPKMETCLEATSLKGHLQQTRVSRSRLRETNERDVDGDSTSRKETYFPWKGGSYFSSTKRNDRISEINGIENADRTDEGNEETTKTEGR